MKYTIKVNEENNILGVLAHRLKSTSIKSSQGFKIGNVESYDMPKDAIEITEEIYNELNGVQDLQYTKFVDGEIIYEPQEEKEERLKLEEENRIKQQDLKDKEDLKALLLKLKGYVKFNNIATDLLNE